MTVEILVDGYPSIVSKRVADYFTALEAERNELRAEVGRLMDENSTLGVLLHNQRVELTELRAENKRLKQAITDHENDCAVLPEDRSVTEYVNELLAQLEAVRAIVNQAWAEDEALLDSLTKKEGKDGG